MARFYCSTALYCGQLLELPEAAARHVQVLRLQPGDLITLFNGGLEGSIPVGGEFEARIERMGRREVQVTVLSHQAIEREPSCAVHLALAVPANERMDWLVEKAAELGVASIQPLISQRSVLRLDGPRAAKKVTHWQAIAIAACEQCGRNRVPVVRDVCNFSDFLRTDFSSTRWMLSLAPSAVHWRTLASQTAPSSVLILSGPEGGLTAQEEEAARACDFVSVTLGPRTLRADTAPLAILSALTLLEP